MPRSLHETLRLAGEGLRLMGVGHYSALKGQHYPPHFHPALELVLFQTGSMQCVISTQPEVTAPLKPGEQTVEVAWTPKAGQQVIAGKPGLALVIPPHQVHRDFATAAYSHHYVLLELPAGLHLASTAWTFMDDLDGSLETLLVNLDREWQRHQAGREDMLRLLLAQLGILAERLERNEGLSAAEQIVLRAERLLEVHFTQDLGMTELAERLNLSASALRSYFAKLRPYSAKEYQRRLRLRRALELIRSSSLSLERIANLSGYDSASHLSRHTRAETGLTPGQYRNKP